MNESTSFLYLSGCSCCPSGSLIGYVPPGVGPGRTGWASRVQRGQHWELSPCSSSPSPHGGSRGQAVAGPSGCPFSYWRCGSLSSCKEDQKQEVSGQIGRRADMMWKRRDWRTDVSGRHRADPKCIFFIHYLHLYLLIFWLCQEFGYAVFCTLEMIYLAKCSREKLKWGDVTHIEPTLRDYQLYVNEWKWP